MVHNCPEKQQQSDPKDLGSKFSRSKNWSSIKMHLVDTLNVNDSFRQTVTVLFSFYCKFSLTRLSHDGIPFT